MLKLHLFIYDVSYLFAELDSNQAFIWSLIASKHDWISPTGWKYKSSAKINKSIPWEAIRYMELTIKSTAYFIINSKLGYTSFISVKFITFVCIYVHIILFDTQLLAYHWV